MQGLMKTASEGAYSCTVCDRGFDSKRDLDTHIAAHTKCSYEGCNFSAQRKIVLSHETKEHSSVKTKGSELLSMPPSLLELIPEKYRGAALVGDSEEEIARWRAERRKNFPTNENVERKRQRAQDAASHGVLQPITSGGKFRRTVPSSQGNASTSGATLTEQNNDKPMNIVSSEASEHASSNEQDSSDSEAPEEMGVGLADATLEAETALESANEVAESRLAEETRLGVLPTKSSMDKSDDLKRPICRNFAARGRCRMGNACRYQHSRAEVKSESTKSVCKWYLLGNCGQGARCSYSHTATSDSGPNSSLLRNLLRSEIQEETSALLQGIRYIVKNGFFLNNN